MNYKFIFIIILIILLVTILISNKNEYFSKKFYVKEPGNHGDIQEQEKGYDVSYAEMKNPNLESEDHYWIKVPVKGGIFTRGNDGEQKEKTKCEDDEYEVSPGSDTKEYVKKYQIAQMKKNSVEMKKCMPLGEFFIKVILDNNLFDELTINDTELKEFLPKQQTQYLVYQTEKN